MEKLKAAAGRIKRRFGAGSGFAPSNPLPVPVKVATKSYTGKGADQKPMQVFQFNLTDLKKQEYMMRIASGPVGVVSYDAKWNYDRRKKFGAKPFSLRQELGVCLLTEHVPSSTPVLSFDTPVTPDDLAEMYEKSVVFFEELWKLSITVLKALLDKPPFINKYEAHFRDEDRLIGICDRNEIEMTPERAKQCRAISLLISKHNTMFEPQMISEYLLDEIRTIDKKFNKDRFLYLIDGPIIDIRKLAQEVPGIFVMALERYFWRTDDSLKRQLTEIEKSELSEIDQYMIEQGKKWTPITVQHGTTEVELSDIQEEAETVLRPDDVVQVNGITLKVTMGPNNSKFVWSFDYVRLISPCARDDGESADHDDRKRSREPDDIEDEEAKRFHAGDEAGFGEAA